MKYKDYEYVFVSGSFSPDRGKLATEKQSFGTAIYTTEGWKLTAPPKWTIAFPMNDAEKLQAILDRGAAQVVQGRMEPAPEPKSSSAASNSPGADANASLSPAP